MLKLADLDHLPQVDDLIDHMADSVGLIVVAGPDPRPTPGETPLPSSGRTGIFRLLAGELLERRSSWQAMLIARDRDVLHIPRAMRRRIVVVPVKPARGYREAIDFAAGRRPDLLIVERLDRETLGPALDAAGAGVRVFSQLDTVFRGADVAHHLADQGATATQLRSLAWVIAMQRMPKLCPVCRQPARPDAAQLGRLHQLAAAEHLELDPAETSFATAAGCPTCDHSGRQGEITVFDFYAAREPARRLSLESYALRLAADGQLALDDVLRFEADHLHRAYRLLSASQEALTSANRALERRLAELEAANRVLEQRTAALASLQDIGRALISSESLADLARRVCRYAAELCGADRVLLYLCRHEEMAEVIALSGWDASLLGTSVTLADVVGGDPASDPEPFDGPPPGVVLHHPDREGFALLAGLRVALLAQERCVGAMVVHSTRRPRFAPAELALLRTFADQAALSIQRAELVEQLQEKIAQLEAAQDALVAKERLEREMELAREVQQSVLPRIFPHVAGYAFAARNTPARQVGGDFYDLFRIDEQRFGLVIADVSGKGMPAALYMALSRSLLLAEARREQSPRAALLNVNRLLRELGEPHMFVTVFYGIIDAPARRLTYARAGHDYPLLLRDGQAHPLDAYGVVLGFFPERDLRLEQTEVDLLSDDRLVLYTDGLVDAQNPAGRRFELERLTQLLCRHSSLAPDDLCTAVFDTLTDYQGSAEQYDDMTLLVVAVSSPSERPAELPGAEGAGEGALRQAERQALPTPPP